MAAPTAVLGWAPTGVGYNDLYDLCQRIRNDLLATREDLFRVKVKLQETTNRLETVEKKIVSEQKQAQEYVRDGNLVMNMGLGPAPPAPAKNPSSSPQLNFTQPTAEEPRTVPF